MKVIIIGGVAGGASTAARLRRLNEKAEIIIFEKGPYISFANCGLPYHIGNVIENRGDLILQTPADFKYRFNIDVRIKSEVIKIIREDKKVEIKNHETGQTYFESYDKLVISTGSTPLKPPIPGINGNNIFSLWTIPDMDKIIKFIKENNPKNATIIGGGFIGIEMAENLEELGLNISLVEMAPQVMAPLDFDMAQSIHKHLLSKKVSLILNNGVKSFENAISKTIITLQSGDKIESDIVILAIGIKANSTLAKDADIELNKRGGIVVNSYLETNDKDIYAVGDVIEVDNYISKEKTMIPLAGPANKQGRICANNIMGANEKYEGSLGTSVAKVFDLTVAATGLNEKQLNQSSKKLNIDYKVTIVHPNSHSGYYPGAFPLTLKVIFDLKGKVLGAQAVGYLGVEKRIDVIATAIKFNATIYDLKSLELAYAPPYSSAKDPVNMAGFTAENILNKSMDNILYCELETLDMSKTIILDVRTKGEVKMGCIKGSYNIPVDDLRSRLNELDKSKLIVLYCAVGFRAYLSIRILSQNGFTNIKNLAGGYRTYNTVSKCYTNNSLTPIQPPVFKDTKSDISIDVCGLMCHIASNKVIELFNTLKVDNILNIKSTNPSLVTDIKAWCIKTNNIFVKSEKKNNYFVISILKKTSN